MASSRNYRRGEWVPSRRARKRLLTAIIVMAVLAGAGGYVAVFSPLFWVDQVRVEGVRAVSAADLRKAAFAATERRLGPFQTRSIFLVRPGAVSAEVKRRIKEISTVFVSKSLPHTITLDVSERRSTLLWKTGGSSYLVDQRGIAYEKTEPRDELLQVEDSTRLPVTVGKQVVGANFVMILEEIRQGMKERGFKVTKFRIPETSFEVEAVTNQGWYALFDTARPVESQVDALKLAVPRERPVEYADLRVPGRVYVR